ncbi:recombinase family protein [Kosakonia sp. SMBL-WEM22]|uniref:recombinase family protein n=1 Tax=Kosakonia sp. SMBL-WEM22 TaxID=2725560 RepID=UPI0016592286|nr:recombinase family protein [Kosakonia sp. SMBL-WEM22]
MKLSLPNAAIMRHLVILIQKFRQRDVNFLCFKDSIDASISMERFFFPVMGALAEWNTC